MGDVTQQRLPSSRKQTEQNKDRKIIDPLVSVLRIRLASSISSYSLHSECLSRHVSQGQEVVSAPLKKDSQK